MRDEKLEEGIPHSIAKVPSLTAAAARDDDEVAGAVVRLETYYANYCCHAYSVTLGAELAAASTLQPNRVLEGVDV